ncbi:hypothetical protein L8S00_08610 [Vibrio splendidus]|uniref:HNH endonuclease n=1 Tax=Vibrio splendidus TaxID=29497 RepID=UPI002468C272|nr:hypothetical protein [Vibrio splendidus]MDH5903459.1 hypothetical protein [Vibrio splendidus]
MDKISFDASHLHYIEQYAGDDHTIWNTTTGIVSRIRSAIRTHYKDQQGYRCCYCRQQTLQDHGFVWDCEHILPKAIYPQFLFEPYNLALSCRECNIAKEKFKNQLITEDNEDYCCDGNKYRIIHPHFDIYSEHLNLEELDGTKIYKIITESKGAFTYKCCGLQRFDKKLVGRSHISTDLSKTCEELLKSGVNPEDIIAGFIQKTIAIQHGTDF